MMGPDASQIDQLKAKAAALEDLGASAQSKGDAENHFENAAKLYMQALKLATTREDKTNIKKKCENVLDELEQVMGRPDWKPNTAASTDSVIVHPARDDAEDTSSSKSSSSLGSRLASVHLSEGKSLPQLKKLPDPKSARELSTKEKLILWKASKLNGFNAAPWTNPPETFEFLAATPNKRFVDDIVLGLSDHQKLNLSEWVRIEKALPPPSWNHCLNDVSKPHMRAQRPVDLVQDAASDCSVVASLSAAAARAERGHPEILLNNLWPRSDDGSAPIISPSGKYVVCLNFNGCWRKVVIDDRLPVSKTSRLLHVIDRGNPTLLWPALLEKAYLKIRGGYDFPGSNSCSDIWAFTGWVPEQIFLHDNDIVPAQFWRRLYTAFNYGDVLVTVGTGKLSKRSERHLGLESQHNYVVMGMIERDDKRLFLVKNPWLIGKGWRMGQEATKTSLSNEYFDMETNASYTPTEDTPNESLPRGYFEISLESVMQHFESIFLSWNPGLFKYRQDIHFSWEIEGRKPATASIIENPQFLFKAFGKGVVWFLLSRHFRDTYLEDHPSEQNLDDSPFDLDKDIAGYEEIEGFTSIYVYDCNGYRVYVDEDHLERSPFVNSPQALLRWECVESASYTLVIHQMDLPPSMNGFSLSAFSEMPVELAPAYQKTAMKTSIRSKWTAATSGGNIQSPSYFYNPQFRLGVATKTCLAMLIETSSDQIAVHAKLVHGRGQRVFSLQSRDVLTDTGNYRHGSAVAEHAEIEPGLYTIICSTFEQGQQAEFCLSIESNAECELMPISREGAGLVSYKLSRALFSPQVCKLACPLRPSRLVGVNVTTRSAETKPSPAQLVNYNSRSPLRVTVEIGRGPERRILVASGGGEYSDAQTVRTGKVDLEPRYLLAGDIWLVLDRLTRPADGSQELYEVELFCDAPNALSAGVWREWDG